MSSTVLTAAGFLLFGLGALWVGWYVPARHQPSPAPADDDAPPSLLTSPGGRRMWRMVLTIAGLGLLGFGLTTLRNSSGSTIVVPATAPRLDQLIWIGAIICLNGSFALAVVWTLFYTYQQNNRTRRARERDAQNQ